MRCGSILISSPSLTDPHFVNTLVFIAEHNEKGATGFIFNRVFPRKFNELEAYRHMPALTLYDGGPVEREHLFFIHRRPDHISGGQPIAAGIYLGGDFEQALQLLLTDAIRATDLQLFIGYAGWDAGELEAELAEGSWEIRNTIATWEYLQQ
jgi:putative transcriptional regulator